MFMMIWSKEYRKAPLQVEELPYNTHEERVHAHQRELHLRQQYENVVSKIIDNSTTGVNDHATSNS